MNLENTKTNTIPICLCPHCGTNLVYRDKYGELWIRPTPDTVVRVSDNNVGLWDNGRGLTDILLK